MNHYPRHIGDWMRNTAHLSEVEECIYSRLVDQYYSRERPLPADRIQCCRLVRAINPAGRKAVESVLAEFFTLEPDGYHQKRCDAEIQAQIERSEKAAKAGRIKASKQLLSRARADFEQTIEQDPSNAQILPPITHNPEPITQGVNLKPGPHGPPNPKNGHTKNLGTRLEPGWIIPDDWRTWAIDYRPDLTPENIDREALVFRDYWHSKAGADARKADWPATWRNWIRRKD
jgi:uncharacterized protein YdaU (DUF1376 family)